MRRGAGSERRRGCAQPPSNRLTTQPKRTCMRHVALTPAANAAKLSDQTKGGALWRARAALWAARVAVMSGQPPVPLFASAAADALALAAAAVGEPTADGPEVVSAGVEVGEDIAALDGMPAVWAVGEGVAPVLEEGVDGVRVVESVMGAAERASAAAPESTDAMAAGSAAPVVSKAGVGCWGAMAGKA